MKNISATCVLQEPAPSSALAGWQPESADSSAQEQSRHDLQQVLQMCVEAPGDELLWTEFIRLSQPVIAGVAVKTIRRWARPTPSLVDDLVQETYTKLFANDARALRGFVYQHENALHGFLKVVASNAVQDYYRSVFSKKRGCGREEESLENVDSATRKESILNGDGATAPEYAGMSGAAPASVDQTLERGILLHEIDLCLKSRACEPTFTRDYSIFWLYYEEGLTAKAIASYPCIGLSVKGVESTLLRLTRMVRRKLRPRGKRLRPRTAAVVR